MGVGAKIKEFRNKAGLTQKELAEELHVTYQAVSKWENEDAEPSFGVLKDLCRILNCSADELFDTFKKEEYAQPEEKVQVIERVVVQEQKPVLGVCERCNSPIYEAGDLYRVNHTHRREILCKQCNEKRLRQEKEAQERQRREHEARVRKRRVHSFVWPLICAAILIGLGIAALTRGDTSAGGIWTGAGVLSFTFLGTMILNNTFLTEMWLEMLTWGFKKFPGIIFSFSLDGCLFFITMKILFFLLGIVFISAAVVCATAIAAVISIFVYPVALKRSFDGVDEW